MDGQAMGRWLEMFLGFFVTVLILIDLFMTILYARIGSGIMSYPLASITWRLFCWVSSPFPKRRAKILSFCGPVILVVLVVFWTLALAFGAAFIIHPNLGSSVLSSGSPNTTDFLTALYAGGSSLSIVGSSDFSPQTSVFRLFYLFNSVVGASVITLITTYVIQVYNALLSRNAFGLKIYLLSAETRDAADLLAGLGPHGQFDAGYTNLADIGAELVQVKESHHFYPVLFYVRFTDSYYSVSQFTLTCLDMVTLIKSALDDKQYAWLKKSVAVTQIWNGSMILITTLADTFLSNGKPDPQAIDQPTLDRWRRRYQDALLRLKQADIQTIADEEAGFEVYVSLRKRWEYLIAALAPIMAFQMEEIDPPSFNPQLAEEREDFHSRLHAFDDTY